MKKLILFIICLAPTLIYSQDWGSWSAIQLSYKANDKLTLNVKPIVRHHQDFGAYQNTFFDVSAKYKLSSNWHIALLNRHIFVPDGDDGEFVFFDLGYRKGLSPKLKLSTYLRYHLILDRGAKNVDFLRNLWSLSYEFSEKLSPFISVEPWIKTHEPVELSLARYIIGTKYKFSKDLSLSINYWLQKNYLEVPILGDTHTIVWTLTYNI